MINFKQFAAVALAVASFGASAQTIYGSSTQTAPTSIAQGVTDLYGTSATDMFTFDFVGSTSSDVSVIATNPTSSGFKITGVTFADVTAHTSSYVAADYTATLVRNTVTEADGTFNVIQGDTYVMTVQGTGTGGFSGYVQAVPEPESYAMLLGGLGLIGSIVAKRRKANQG